MLRATEARCHEILGDPVAVGSMVLGPLVSIPAARHLGPRCKSFRSHSQYPLKLHPSSSLASFPPA